MSNKLFDFYMVKFFLGTAAFNQARPTDNNLRSERCAA
jgi:hypothetical protein